MNTSYLKRENWPECIPWTEPTREYEPAAWRPPGHEDPHGLDTYPHSHWSAASLGDTYIGDVCPWCGVPVRRDEVVVAVFGYDRRGPNADRGVFWEINDVGDPVPAYHPECWREREAARTGLRQAEVTEFAPP